MVELFLFLSTFCLLFFLPVQFQIFYKKIAWDDTLVLEISFLKGYLKIRKVISLLQLKPTKVRKRVKLSGRWFFLRKKKTKKVESPYFKNSRGMREFLHRYQHFGLGMTLLTYFLPANYQRLLLVVDDLEKRGVIIRFTSITKLGTGNPAITAQLCGALWGALSGLLGLLREKIKFDGPPEIKVIPDFQNPRLDLIFDCIFRVKLGYIIIAAFIAHFRYRMLKGGGIGVGKPSN